jgi:large subunit ribosomal protein L9
MDVILLENIEGLGRKGDRVNVRHGYGRNHLLPYHRAIAATPDALSRLESMKKKFAVEEAKIVSELKGVAGKLEGLKVELMMRATPEGHLFGSVSPNVLVAALKEKGYDVAERDFRIKEPIKTVGTYTVGIHLHADVKVNITVVVDAEGAPQQPAEGEAAAPEAAAAATTPPTDAAPAS